MAAIGALSALDWNSVLNDPKAGVSLIAASMVMAVMRSLTTTAPGQSPSQVPPSSEPPPSSRSLKR